MRLNRLGHYNQFLLIVFFELFEEEKPTNINNVITNLENDFSIVNYILHV